MRFCARCVWDDTVTYFLFFNVIKSVLVSQAAASCRKSKSNNELRVRWFCSLFFIVFIFFCPQRGSLKASALSRAGICLSTSSSAIQAGSSPATLSPKGHPRACPVEAPSLRADSPCAVRAHGAAGATRPVLATPSRCLRGRAQAWASPVCCCSLPTSASSRCTTSPLAWSSARAW